MKKVGKKKTRVFCTNYNCSDLLLGQLFLRAAKYTEFHISDSLLEALAIRQLIKTSIKNTILTSVWTYTYLTAPRHY